MNTFVCVVHGFSRPMPGFNRRVLCSYSPEQRKAFLRKSRSYLEIRRVELSHALVRREPVAVHADAAAIDAMALVARFEHGIGLVAAFRAAKPEAVKSDALMLGWKSGLHFISRSQNRQRSTG